MKKTRKCGHCGREFTVTNGTKKYCCAQCAREAERERRHRQKELLRAVEPVERLRQQEYLTFSKAAVLMGCTRQYIYKLVGQGKLRASRLSSRMALIRRADIERMLDSNPYNRVLPGSRPKEESAGKRGKAVGKQQSKGRKANAQAESRARAENEPLTYISGEELIAIYKVKRSWLYASARRNRIPVCRIAGKNYYSKRHVEDCLGVTAEVEAISDWLTATEASEAFGMGKEALRTYAYRHNIPTKREYGITYYSKSHIAELRQQDVLADVRYCTVEEVEERYGLTKANIHHIVKASGVSKVKVGVRNLLLRSDIERVMAERAARGL